MGSDTENSESGDSETGFVCRGCGEWHDFLPFSYHAGSPADWSDELEDEDGCALTEEQCIINGERFYVHALVGLPVLDAEENFEWGVWVSLSEANFQRMSDAWEEPGRENMEPMFAWLSTELPVYEPSTLGLKTMVHTQPVGFRPLVELEPTDHPLAVEQRNGITVARVQQLAEILLHGD